MAKTVNMMKVESNIYDIANVSLVLETICEVSIDSDDLRQLVTFQCKLLNKIYKNLVKELDL